MKPQNVWALLGKIITTDNKAKASTASDWCILCIEISTNQEDLVYISDSKKFTVFRNVFEKTKETAKWSGSSKATRKKQNCQCLLPENDDWKEDWPAAL